jgi:preprotein translocase subunit YajC
MDYVWILAQTDPNQAPTRIPSKPLDSESEAITTIPSDANAPAQRTTAPRSPWLQMLPFVLIFVVMYLLLFRGPRKKQQEHKQMVQSLEKNDRVRTIGGIIGTVVDIRDDEVTLKIDESNNTKIKIITSAIGKNLSKEKK